MSELEKMLAGAPHQPYDAALTAMRQRCRDILWRYNTQTPPHDTAARTALLTELLGELPEGIYISAPFYCDYGRHIHVGKNFYSNVGCTILDGAPVHIGDNTSSLPRTSASTRSTTRCIPTCAAPPGSRRCPSPSAMMSGCAAALSSCPG